MPDSKKQKPFFSDGSFLVFKNYRICKKRKAFYLRNGLQETGLFVNVYDTDFEILTPDGELTFWEYVDFLREVMYEEYVQILRPTLIAMKK